MTADAGDSPLLAWAVAHTPFAEGSVSGDAYCLDVLPDGIYAAVVDGLGHGEAAHAAATKAIATLGEQPQRGIEQHFKVTHDALIGTRGAVMTLIQIHPHTATLHWAGVGNVRGVLLPAAGNIQRERRHLLTRGGIVGYRMPPIKRFSEALMPGATLILATDGIDSAFLEDIPHTAAPLAIAEYVLNNHNQGTDDALVLVLRYAPSEPGV